MLRIGGIGLDEEPELLEAGEPPRGSCAAQSDRCTALDAVLNFGIVAAVVPAHQLDQQLSFGWPRLAKGGRVEQPVFEADFALLPECAVIRIEKRDLPLPGPAPGFLVETRIAR